MADKFANASGDLAGLLLSGMTSGFAITSSDTTIFSQPTRGVWIGGLGNLAVRMLDGTTPIFVAVPAGTWLPIRIDKVLATGTTATNVYGFY